MSYQILITGAGTSVGNYIAKHLSINNKIVTATYNKNKPNNLKNCRLIKIDLSKKIKKNIKFNYLVHCASKIPRDGQSVKNYKENIKFTKIY